MTTPEGPGAPKHEFDVSELWQHLVSLSDEVLKDGEVALSKANEKTSLQRIWRNAASGFVFLLTRDVQASGPGTKYTLSFESDLESGYGFIAEGKDAPSAINPKPYGIFVYSEANGLEEEPKGTLPGRLSMFENDPVAKRAVYYEAIEEFLGFAKAGWQEQT